MDIQDPVPYCNERFYCNCTYIIYRNAKIWNYLYTSLRNMSRRSMLEWS
jgi:hypothetical protein